MKVITKGAADITIDGDEIKSKYELDIKESGDTVNISLKSPGKGDDSEGSEKKSGWNFNLFGMNVSIGGVTTQDNIQSNVYNGDKVCGNIVQNSSIIINGRNRTIINNGVNIKPKYKNPKAQYTLKKPLSSAKVQGSGDITILPTTNIDFNMDLLVQGSGDINIKGLFVFREFNAKVQGSGDINIQEVRADIMNLFVQGSGDIDGHKIKCPNIKQKIQGSGDIDVLD